MNHARRRMLRRGAAAAVAAAVATVTFAPAAQAAPESVTAANDWDGDGNADLIVVSDRGQLLLYPGNGASGFKRPEVLGPRGWNGFDLVRLAGDVDDDGANDILARTTGGVLYLYRGDGSGGFTGGYTPLSYGWGIYEDILPMDGDGDGHVDLYATDHATNYMYRYTGEEGAAWRTRAGIASGARGWDVILDPGDTNGDGYAEIDVRESATGRLINYQLNAKGLFQHSSTSRLKGTGFGAFTALVTPGDFSGDGYSDTIGRVPNGDLYLYEGTSTGALTKGVRIGTGWNGLRFL